MEQKTKKRFEKIENRVEKIEKTIFRLSKKGKLIKCPKCGNSWITRSKSELVSCTSCGNKVRIEKPNKDLYAKGKGWGEQAEKVL